MNLAQLMNGDVQNAESVQLDRPRARAPRQTRKAMTRRLRALVATLTPTLLVLAGTGDEGRTQDPSDETSREIMWRKLDLSHDVLDALVLEDFEALHAYAEDLEALGTAGFLFILDTNEYRTRAEEFRAAARALGSAARGENAEAGALAYLDLTLRCVRCHRSLGVLPR